MLTVRREKEEIKEVVIEIAKHQGLTETMITTIQTQIDGYMQEPEVGYSNEPFKGLPEWMHEEIKMAPPKREAFSLEALFKDVGKKNKIKPFEVEEEGIGE